MQFEHQKPENTYFLIRNHLKVCPKHALCYLMLVCILNPEPNANLILKIQIIIQCSLIIHVSLLNKVISSMIEITCPQYEVSWNALTRSKCLLQLMEEIKCRLDHPFKSIIDATETYCK